MRNAISIVFLFAIGFAATQNTKAQLAKTPVTETASVVRRMVDVFPAKTLSGSEINSLHIFLNPIICYNSRPCFASSGSGSAQSPVSFAHAKAFSLRTWRFDRGSPS
jgi:hypothetical protein